MLKLPFAIPSPGDRDQSPLMVAAYSGYVELMKLLLGAFAKVNLRASRQGVTALFMALQYPEAVKAGRQTRRDEIVRSRPKNSRPTGVLVRVRM